MITEPDYTTIKYQVPALRYVQTPKVLRILARLFTFTMLVIILGLIFIPWVQNFQGTGNVIAYTPLERRQNITAPISGVIVKWYVKEGDFVEEGEVILEMSDNDPRLMERLQQQKDFLQDQLLAYTNKLESYRVRLISLENARYSAISIEEASIQMALAKMNEEDRELEAAIANLNTSELNYNRTLSLQKKGLASQREIELAELSYQKNKADVGKAQQALEGAKRYVEASQAKKEKIMHDADAYISSGQSTIAESEADIAKIKAEISKIDTSISRQSMQTVRAPRRGFILKLLKAQSTDMVKSSDPIAVFIPETNEKAVEIYISGNDIPLVNIGRKVRLKFEGWPAIQFAGWPSVAIGTFGGEVKIIDAATNQDDKFRIVVTPDQEDLPWPDNRYLRQGIRVVGWVLLDEVSLGFELWRQFNGFPPAIKQDKEMDKSIYKKKVK